jgi:predicted PurR-regulated permease PerM
LWRKLLSIIPNRSFEFVAALESILSKRLFAYFSIEFGHSLLTGILITVALKLLGFPFPLSYGVFAAFTVMIPTWGVILGVSLPVIETVFTTGTAAHLIGLALAFMATTLFCHALFDQALRRSRPNFSLISQVLFPVLGAIIAGLPGMLLAIPVVSVLRLIWLSIDRVTICEPIPPNHHDQS